MSFHRSFHRLSVVFVALVVAGALAVDFGALAAAEAPAAGGLAHHLKRGFRNPDATYSYTMSGRALRLLSRTFEGWPARGAPPTVLSNDGAACARTATSRR